MAVVVSPTPLVNPVVSSRPATKFSWILGLVVIAVGIAAGYFLNRLTSSSAANSAVKGENMINTATEVGSSDTKTYRDTATGVLEAGGSNGEGTHKLIRDGGPSKTAYLVSSVVDLDQFVGKKVEVWGETMKAQKVGWLMDVGRVKILE